MDEGNVNNAVIHLFPAGYKIPDPTREEIRRGAKKRPFDVFAGREGQLYCIEDKFQRGYHAFNFNKIEDHQFWWLDHFKRNGGAISWVCLGVWEPYKFLDLLFFDIDFIVKCKETMKSFKQKDLLKWKELGFTMNAKTATFEGIRVIDKWYE